MSENIIIIYTDGACKGNPGPGGWGALITHNGITKELFGGHPNTTNNRMEIYAAIKAVESLDENSRVRIHADSKYVIEGISSWLPGWKNRGWKTAAKQPVKNEDLWRRLDAAIQGHIIDWQWVRGHVGNPGNERADALANKGVGMNDDDEQLVAVDFKVGTVALAEDTSAGNEWRPVM